MVDRAIELVGPGRIREDASDAGSDFLLGLLVADHRREAACDLRLPKRQILGHVIKNLGAVVGSCLCPAGSLPRSLDSIANVFAVAKRRLAENLAVRAADLDAVAGIGARLFSSDVQLHGAVDGQASVLVAVIGFGLRRFRCWQCGRTLEPDRLEIFPEAFASAFAAITAFAVSAESA